MDISTEDFNSTMISIVLGIILWFLDHIYMGATVLIGFISTDIRLFMLEWKELIQLITAALILFKVSLEVGKSFKKK